MTPTEVLARHKTAWDGVIPEHNHAAVQQILLAIIKLQIRSPLPPLQAKALASIAATAVGLLAAKGDDK